MRLTVVFNHPTSPNLYACGQGGATQKLDLQTRLGGKLLSNTLRLQILLADVGLGLLDKRRLSLYSSTKCSPQPGG